MSFSSQTPQNNDSQILDYKVITSPFTMDSKTVTSFINTITSYLKKGYCLRGSIKTIGPHISQVIVRYSKPTLPLVIDYTLIGQKFSHNNSWFENKIMEYIHDGWELYGDHDYSAYDTAQDSQFWQVLVKYNKPEVNLLDL